MRNMEDMFETNELESVITTFQSLLIENQRLDDYELNKSLHYTLKVLHDFAYLKHAIDTSVIVAATDTKGTIIYANDKFCEISQYSQEELIGQNHRILNSKYHDKNFFRQIWKQISQGDVWEGEIRNLAKDGSIYWVKTTIVPLLDQHKKPIMYMSLRTDITEGKLAQEKLVTALENDFRLVVNSMHSLIFKVAKYSTNRYKYTLNEGKLATALELDLVGKTIQEVFPEKISTFLEEKYKQAFTGKNVSYQYSYKEKELLTNLSPIYRDGQIVELIGCINDITELNDAQEKIKYLAFHDSITNLPNRRKFKDDFEEYILHNQDKRFAIFFLDLDRFKQINDTFGHTAGDSLIIEVALRLKEVVGDNGTIYRFAGDEFIIVFPDGDLTLVHQHALKILNLFEQRFILSNKLEVYTTTSIGISIFPDHGLDYDTLLKNADTAMYSAKANNRNIYTIYQHDMSQHYEEALVIERYLRSAIEQNELELHYQPKLDLTSKRINGIEALLRWKNPILGNIPPSKFIPVAEDTGLIIKLDEWVLEKACEQNLIWNQEFGGLSPIKMAVNISPQHFRLPQFEKVVERVLMKTGLPPELLEIEITEHSFIDNTEECIVCLNKLNKMGVTVAIDDFGIGYSSLNYLRKLPIHSLKIDRTFIQEMAENTEDRAIVKAITYLAHEINLKVVAEGIETSEVMDVLHQLGCDEIQGFFISKPLPRNEFAELFKRINS